MAIPGQSLRFIPVERSHMDGDALVWFPAARVLVMGDLHHSHEYPVYDGQSGCKCSYDGNLRVYRQAIAMIDDSAIVVPGHGSLTNRRELIVYLAMLEKARADVAAAIAAGQSRAQVIAAKPLAGDRSVQPGGPDNADAFIGACMMRSRPGRSLIASVYFT
jgi:glyoxylase-like metal-dependent hydrolase (beta-lactamase superfamily II)